MSDSKVEAERWSKRCRTAMFDDDILLPSTSSLRPPTAFPFPHSTTATQLLSALRHHPRFYTGSARLDSLLDGGLARGQMLEIGSPPAGGKTKIAVGMAVRAVLGAMTTKQAEPVQALYIDADGSATPSLVHAAALAACRDSDDKEALAMRVCARIQLVRIRSTSELALYFLNLPSWLNDNPEVKLIVLDSISAHTKPVILEKSERAHVFNLAKTAFTRATTIHSCAVLVTSQMSTKLFSSTTGAPSDFRLGDLAFLSTPGPGLVGEAGAWLPREAKRVSLYFDKEGARRAMVISGAGGAKGGEGAGEGVVFGLDDIGACDILDGTIT